MGQRHFNHLISLVSQIIRFKFKSKIILSSSIALQDAFSSRFSTRPHRQSLYVTGGNSGIGYCTVARLAQHGAHVYLCCRSAAKGTAATAGIKAIYLETHITILKMDHLSLLSTVVAAAKHVISQEADLHGLINNAGIMATPFEMTKEGHEAQWQTNYLALALPPGSVRIVNLSSGCHFSALKGGISFTDTSPPKANNQARYEQSKLANVLHIKTLSKLYGPDSSSSKAENGEIWTAAVHPGLVQSNLGVRAEFPVWMKTLFQVYFALGGRSMEADKGSWTSVFCAASPDMKREQSGTYFGSIAKAGWQSGMAKNAELAAKLEEWTRKVMAQEGFLE